MFSHAEWEETANVQSQKKTKQLMFSHMGGNSSKNYNVQSLGMGENS
jgi:hypothetical protein